MPISAYCACHCLSRIPEQWPLGLCSWVLFYFVEEVTLTTRSEVMWLHCNSSHLTQRRSRSEWCRCDDSAVLDFAVVELHRHFPRNLLVSLVQDNRELSLAKLPQGQEPNASLQQSPSPPIPHCSTGEGGSAHLLFGAYDAETPTRAGCPGLLSQSAEREQMLLGHSSSGPKRGTKGTKSAL